MTMSSLFANVYFIYVSITFPKYSLQFTVYSALWRQSDICTKYCDDGFRVDSGYIGHFRGTKIVGGGSQVLLLSFNILLGVVFFILEYL